MMNKTIALDMDGTSAIGTEPIRGELVQYLSDLVDEGWNIVFVTGRTFVWSWASLKRLRFPYYLLVQNGAVALRMPGKRVVQKYYLESSLYPKVETICEAHGTDFVLYLGPEYKDRVVYRPEKLSLELRKYLAQRCQTINEKWDRVASYDQVSHCASFKCFGEREALELICSQLKTSLQLSVATIKDPINSAYSIVQATHPKGNKGDALLALTGRGTLIAAGDDFNDEPMFDVADISVVMASAPDALKARADIVAPPVEECGLIEGLEQAINRIEG